MANSTSRRWSQSQEASGFLVAVGFVCLAAVRDVYLGGLFQRITPLLIAAVAFSLCTLLFLPVALGSSRRSLVLLWRHFGEVFLVNVTSACAWLAFFYALKLIEPSIVQILYSGIGPPSVIWIERRFSATSRETPLTRAEWFAFLALLMTLVFSAMIVLLRLSGMTSASTGNTAIGLLLAAGGGVSISVSTMLCRRLNDSGVKPGALLAVRYPATAISAVVIMAFSPSPLSDEPSLLDAAVATAALLIIVPSYVNQVAISLASPLTVRVVLAVGPVLIFLCQLIEGRVAASSYSLMAAILYGFAAISAAIARQRAIAKQ
jgi:drug/metabolite transporter (DMT)-like permease